MLMPSIFGESLFDDWFDDFDRQGLMILTARCSTWTAVFTDAMQIVK